MVLDVSASHNLKVSFASKNPNLSINECTKLLRFLKKMA